MPDSKETYIDWAHEVLSQEAQALIDAKAQLDEQFSRAVDTILDRKGKVVVSGLGKSGHVGRKIAATLASTGTPAFFLHPTEALHGDLGVIGSQDSLLAIAYGGETAETLAVASFAKRQEIPVVALTGQRKSTLAELADLVLDGSVKNEACPLKLAPTTSTTLAMAIGDCLAVALMRARGFAQEDFARFHPSGSLGRQLSRVGDHMRSELLNLSPDDGFHRILEVITAHNFGIAAVVENGKLVGAITDGDLRRALVASESEVFNLKAKQLMSKNPKTISANRFAMDAVHYMENKSINTLFVVSEESSELVGLVRMYDLLQAKVV